MLTLRRAGLARYAVVRGTEILGHIVRHDERCGRPAWRLEADTSLSPRMYRGRLAAARALSLALELARTRCTRTQLVILAWERRP